MHGPLSSPVILGLLVAGSWDAIRIIAEEACNMKAKTFGANCGVATERVFWFEREELEYYGDFQRGQSQRYL